MGGSQSEGDSNGANALINLLTAKTAVKYTFNQKKYGTVN